jgi:hypothetical protein
MLAVRAARRDVPDQATAVLASAGSFAAISTLLGSPIAGAFLLMEASGLGGPMLGLVLVPGLLAAGIGSLIFTGLDAWTGLGTFSLAIPGLPHFGSPTIAELGWAVVVGLAAALVGAGIRWLGLRLQPFSLRSPPVAALVAGLVVAGLAIAYAEGAGKNASDVLFSGQSALGPLITNSATYSVGALLLLLVCKSLAGRRHGAVASAWLAAGGRRGHGHRGDGRGHAQPPADVGAASDAAAGLRRPGRHAAGNRGGRGRLRRLGQDRAGRTGADPESPDGACAADPSVTPGS